MPPPPLHADQPKKKTQLTAFLHRPKASDPPSQLTSDPFEPLPPSSSTAPGPHTRVVAPRVLAVDIPISTLRPIAFRVFTKKHNLTLRSEALTLLCQFIGRRCGAEWRDTGAGEKLLDEIARQWKRNESGGKILVEGDEGLKNVLKGLDVPSSGGAGGREKPPSLNRSPSSFDLTADISSSMLMGGGNDDASEDVEMGDGEIDELEGKVDPKEYFKVVDAFEQPKLVYNVTKKVFERGVKPSLFPPPSSKTALFRSRYNILYNRLLRNESFLAPTFQKAPANSASKKTYYKLTAISTLLGRAGQNFILFGMLQYSPAGVLTLYDPTGSIILDTSYTQPIPYESANWICPGMFVILDGVYEEDGRFTAYTVLSPPPERREVSAEVFGHVDFLGIGVTLDMSSPAGGGGGQQGHLMRKVEIGLTHIRWAVFGEVLLDSPRTFEALRHVFAKYENNINKPTPMVWVLCGNFCSTPVSPGGEGSRQYKEGFDSLAALLSEFDRVCAHSVFIFIPGDNDPWASTFSGGSSPAWPRKSVPDVFVNRVKRAVTQKGGELRCASNPCRLGYFTSEVVVCRDNIVGRLHRSEIRFLKKSETVVEDGRDMDLDLDPPSDLPNNCNRPEVDDDVKLARKLVKTVLDQGFLSPFPLNKRPVLWDFAYTLGLYPLPSALLLVDTDIQPFTVTYEGCHVCNPGKFIDRRKATWAEYTPSERRGCIIQEGF